MKIVVSACLLGKPCRYDGRSKPCEKVIALAERADTEIIEICPEQLGGLPTPRVPSEIVGDKVISKDGRDVTEFFVSGAKKALDIAKENDCKYAILKSLSPSCSVCGVYDGSFSGKVVGGMGVTAKLLKENGIKVVSENEI
ncbi:MAG: DUF523 domain-containing protein [Ruminococcaceae bacterium]|nr:DUF523 domain-containing protein [Oscillospiraceae bacterium]